MGSWPGGGGAGGLEGHRKLGQGVWGSRAARGGVDIHWGGVGGVWGADSLRCGMSGLRHTLADPPGPLARGGEVRVQC